MIFHLGKKRRKLACHRHMGWVFAREGPSSSCCLLPLLRSVSPEDTPTFTYFEGENSRGNLNYFYDFWRHFCSRTCHVQTKDRPVSGHYPMWMKFGGVWWWQCPASLRIWECLMCLTHYLVSWLPLAIPPLPQVPWPQGMLQLCQRCPGHLGIVQELLQGLGAALMGRAVAQLSLFLVELFV